MPTGLATVVMAPPAAPAWGVPPVGGTAVADAAGADVDTALALGYGDETGEPDAEGPGRPAGAVAVAAICGAPLLLAVGAPRGALVPAPQLTGGVGGMAAGAVVPGNRVGTAVELGWRVGVGPADWGVRTAVATVVGTACV